jgi:hypothetical protein
MNARIILGTLAVIVVTLTALTAGSVIWFVTAEPQTLASGHISRGITGVAIAAVTRALSMLW